MVDRQEIQNDSDPDTEGLQGNNQYYYIMPDQVKESLRRQVYFAARDGMGMALYALLDHIPQKDIKEYIEVPTGERGTKCTPLIVAAVNGHYYAVKMILHHFSANIEQEGNVFVNSILIKGATALWCAAGAGHLAVVKCLVFYGADVNHATHSNSTPLRAACFDGHLEVVQFLVEHGADIHITNKYSNTCLMVSAFKGHLDVVSYLISKNIDLDANAQCGFTALHFAAKQGQLTIVEKLLNCGAKIVKDQNGMTPLMTAAERTKANVVEYLIENSWFSKEECVEALELLGASYGNDKDHYSVEEAYYYMEWALRMRENDPASFRPKIKMSPIACYDDHEECQTLAELQAIRHDLNALHMESLVIRERILGPQNPEISHPIIFRGAVFADFGQFDKCINLWLRALQLQNDNQASTLKDLLRFSQVFSQMIHIGEDVHLEHIKQVLAVAMDELERNIQATHSDSMDTRTNAILELEENMYSTLYLLVISTKIIKKYSHSEEHSFCDIVYRINKLPLSTLVGSTLLHLAVSTNTPVDNFHTRNVCKFPCAATTRLLIQCGADVNAIDNAGNTPLHIIVGYQKPITDFMTLHSIINQLIEAGAHVDYVNNNGETPADAVLTGVAEIILKGQYKLSLRCLAAKVIREYNIPYENKVPQSLVEFTDRHGIPRTHEKNKKTL